MRRNEKMKKTKIFSDGTFVTANSKGEIKKASQEEVSDYLVSLFPEKKDGAEITHVKFDKESGYAKARYSSGKVYRKKVAQTKQTEPVNSVDKSDPDAKVPRDKKKAKPEIDVGRSDVDNPDEVRKDNYDKGPGGKNLHTNKVPRDKSGDGVGGESVGFEEETSEKATSGKPDSYVQDFSKSEDPSKAGSEENHATAAKSDVKFATQDEIYTKLKLAEMDEDEEDKEQDEDPEEETNEKKTEKSKKEGESKNREIVAQLKEEVTSAQGELKKASVEIQELRKQIANRKIREARTKAATGLALMLRDRYPKKYFTAEKFNEKIEGLAKKMSVEAIETAIEELNSIRTQEAEREENIKSASKKEADMVKEAGATSILTVPTDENEEEDLASILAANTRLGKEVISMDKYHNSLDEE